MINIFNHAHHIAHQYELYKTPETLWHLCVNSVRKWGRYRPEPENVRYVPHFEEGKYDMAVIHLDQQCVDPTFGKTRLYKEMNDSIKGIPKVVINHATPFWPEVFPEDEIIARMKMLIGDNHVVYNSHRAKEMWEKNGPMGRTSRVIIHGMDENEWWDLLKEPRVVTCLSPAGLPKYYNRALLAEVQGKLKERGIAHVWVGGDKSFEGFDDWREFLGRSLVYFNPTLESPMPRSRTEAMLSGCCIVTLPNHGAEKFIRQGENGFLVPNNPEVCADLLEKLVRDNYKAAVAIGQEGRKTALEQFKLSRFSSEWRELIREITGK